MQVSGIFALLGSHLGLCFCCILFNCAKFSFLTFSLLLGAPIENLIGCIFFGSTAGVTMGMTPQLSPLEVLHG